MTRLLPAATTVVWGALALGACSAERLRPVGSARDATVDTFTSVDSLGVDRCTGSVSDLGTKCPISFDGAVADLPACSGLGQTVKLCSDVLALGLWSGFTGADLLLRRRDSRPRRWAGDE